MGDVHVFPTLPGEDDEQALARHLAQHDDAGEPRVFEATQVFVLDGDEWVPFGTTDTDLEFLPTAAIGPGGLGDQLTGARPDLVLFDEAPAGLSFSFETTLDRDTVDTMRELYGLPPARPPWWRRALDKVRRVLA